MSRRLQDDVSDSAGRHGEDVQGINEGYVVLYDPQFGVDLNGYLVDTDMSGIEIGPLSEVDAIVIQSRSFSTGNGSQKGMVVTKDKPFLGYIKGPFRIKPYYFAEQISDAIRLDGSDIGPHAMQVICWTKPPTVLLPCKRAPLIYRIDENTFETGQEYALPTYGRKYIKIAIQRSENSAIPFTLWLGSIGFRRTAGQFYNNWYTDRQVASALAPPPYGPSMRSKWVPPEMDFPGFKAGTQPCYEWSFDLVTVGGSNDEIVKNRSVRPEWARILIENPDGSSTGFGLSMEVTVYDE